MAPFVYRITPYEPAAASSTSGRFPTRTRVRHDSHEAIAAAYIAATAGFALDAGIHHLAIDNPMTTNHGSASGPYSPSPSWPCRSRRTRSRSNEPCGSRS